MTDWEDYQAQAREMIARVIERALMELALVRIRQELGAGAVAALALQAIGFSPRAIAEILDIPRSEVGDLIRRSQHLAREERE